MKIDQVKTYPDYYNNYFPLFPKDTSLLDALMKRISAIETFYYSIPLDKWNYSYEEGKWTLAQLVRHSIDAELIFTNRALRIARGEEGKLSGWNQEDYAIASLDSNLDSEYLLESIVLQAKNSYQIFKGFSEKDLSKIGNASNHDVSVGALGFIIYVHELHHRNIINSKYLN